MAFVATIYGVASANLVLLPIASKLTAIAMRQSQNLTDNLSADAFYQLDWEPSEADNCGTFSPSLT